MTTATDTPSSSDPGDKMPFMALGLIAGLFFIELTVIGTLFKHLIDFECLANWPQPVCKNASNTLVSIYCLLGVVILLYMVRPAPIKTLTQTAGQRLWPLSLNFAGVCVALVPLAFLSNGQGAATVIPALVLWTCGMSLMLAGVALFVAPLGRWTVFVSNQWSSLLPAFVAAMVAPWLSVTLQPIWSIDWIADQTFTAVEWLMHSAGYELQSDPVQKVIGAGDFFIRVAKVCSGIEGIALVTLFVTLYLWLFRKDLRFPLAFILYPLGIMTSVFFNILRISILLWIGLEGNPELAVGGFHSHAGWMMFTLVALGIIAVAQNTPALRRKNVDSVHAKTALPPFWQDPVVAQILPFAVFMLSALFASTLSQTPSAVYPVRVAVMVGVLALVLPYFRQMTWRIDPVAVGVGAVIAVYWVLIPVAPSDDPAPYGQLTGLLLVLWFMARGLGTIILVPVIEEVFFRGYLEKRLRFGTTPLWLVVAAILSATLFAALHGRWAEAFAAGLLFSWVAWRRGNVADAIVSHSVANALIFAAAVITGNLAMM